MRILVISLNYAPELTATGKYTGEMAEWFSAHGNIVEVIAAPPHYPNWDVEETYKHSYFKREELNGVTVMRVPCFIPKASSLNAKTRILMECSFTVLSLFWWLKIFSSFRKFDVVIAVCPPMQTALFAFLYKSIRGVPYVFHIQDFQVDMALELGIMRPKFLARFLYRLERFFLKRASKVTTITEAMLNRAKAKGVDSNNLGLVPNWSNIDLVRPGKLDNKFRRQHNLHPDDFVVLYAGAMGEKQGLEVVIEAAKTLENEAKIKFVLVGNGGNRQQLEHLASTKKLTNIIFLDLQPASALSDMLSAANVHLVIQRKQASDFVMPSKLTNILASGRPSIATSTQDSALGIVLNKYKTGLVIEPESHLALGESILHLYCSPKEAEKMGTNARAYAERFLNIDSILGEFDEMLHQLKSH